MCPCLRELLGARQCRLEARECCLLRIGDGCHQAQVITDGVAIAELPQALRTRCKYAVSIGQANPWDRALNERLDLTGLENPLHWLDRVAANWLALPAGQYRREVPEPGTLLIYLVIWRNQAR